MSLIQDILEENSLTEREKGIRNYLLAHPDNLVAFSCKDLGRATYTSAATVTRFCKKFSCSGYPEFKLRFLSDVKSEGVPLDGDDLRLYETESIVTILEKVSGLQQKALTAAKRRLSFSQLERLQKLLVTAEYIDFYAYDANIHLARYACSLFFHAGKCAATYSESNTQVLGALAGLPGHLAVLISHTGESKRLIEIARLLRKKGTKVIVISSGKTTALGQLADEFLYAPIAEGADRMWTSAFSTAAKYLLDIMYAIVFCADYKRNIDRNQEYEDIGANYFWSLTSSELRV